MMAMSYGNVYVAKIAIGANTNQVVKAFVEAESYPGPSLILAYSHCIAHGINMTTGYAQGKKAVESGVTGRSMRFDPRGVAAQGKNPLQMDSKAPTMDFEEYAYSENRYRMLVQSDPVAAESLMKEAQAVLLARWHEYENLAKQEA